VSEEHSGVDIQGCSYLYAERNRISMLTVSHLSCLSNPS
jgi:hypothetical protein